MKKYILIVLISLVVFTILFIWGNSMKPSEISNATSDQIADILEPIVKPVFEVVRVEDTYFGLYYPQFIRKIAHVVEFMLLGMLLVGIKLVSKRFTIVGILLSLLTVAVIDETIQSFTNRTVLMADVWLDFISGIIGVGIVFGVWWLIRKTRK